MSFCIAKKIISLNLFLLVQAVQTFENIPSPIVDEERIEKAFY
jgi:hypothetical protein